MTASPFITGFALSASLIVAIGAQNAFVLRQGLRREHVAAVVLFCAASDALLMVAGVCGAGSALRRLPRLSSALTLIGAVFLALYGARAMVRALRPGHLAVAGGAPMALAAALAQAAAFTLLNPHVYLDTVLLVGSIGGRLPVPGQIAFLGGASLASGLWFSSLGWGARWLQPLFARPAAWRVLDALVGLTMWAIAATLLIQQMHGGGPAPLDP